MVNLPPPCRNAVPRETRNLLSRSDKHLPSDIEQLIQVLMQFLEKRNWHPILFSSADDYDRFLEWKEIDPSSIICLDDQLRQSVGQRSGIDPLGQLD
jgi:hypothetical protein